MNDNNNERNVEDGSIDPATMAKTMDIDRDEDIDGDNDDGDGNDQDRECVGGGYGGDGEGDGNGNGNDVTAALLTGIGGNVSVNINMEKCSVNELVLNQDAIEYAKEELEKLNLGKVRVCKRARRLRAKLMSTAVMDSVTAMHNLDEEENNENEGSRHQYIDAGFERVTEEIRTGGGHELIF